MKRLLATVFVLVFAVAACGGGDTDPEAQRQCNALAQSFCEINSSCALETGAITEEQQSEALARCVTDLQQSFSCSSVAKAKGDPDLCVADLAATPCTEFDPANGLPIPLNCRGVFER